MNIINNIKVVMRCAMNSAHRHHRLCAFFNFTAAMAVLVALLSLTSAMAGDPISSGVSGQGHIRLDFTAPTSDRKTNKSGRNHGLTEQDRSGTSSERPLPGLHPERGAQRLSRTARVARDIEWFARGVMNLRDAACSVTGRDVVIRMDITGLEGNDIFIAMSTLAVLAGISAPWTQEVRMDLVKGKQLMAQVRVPTHAVLRLSQGLIDETLFYRTWIMRDLTRMEQARSEERNSLRGHMRAKTTPAQSPSHSSQGRTAQGRIGKGGHYRAVYEVDLDGDGRLELVALVPAQAVPGGICHRPIVKDDDNSVLWEGPKTAPMMQAEPFFFCELESGITMPEVVGDVEGDGIVEIISPVLDQNPVRPQIFRKLRWLNGQFVPVRYKILASPPHNKRRLVWMPADRENVRRWVAGFSRIERPGVVHVLINDLLNADQNSMSAARIVSDGMGGFTIERNTP